MNIPGDSLQIDENLARMIAACDQAMEGADPKAPTIGIPSVRSPLPGERLLGPPSSGEPNEVSVGVVLPDSQNSKQNAVPLPPVSTPEPGAPTPRIGRFELRRQLGKGGCGIVFLAYDPKLEREVALKIPRPEMLLSQDARRRLLREALAAAEFDHPNLVPVYETGEIGPICYIATAFCPGQTLGEWLDRQSFPVPVRQTARLIATVAEAVQHAHDRGVLHRDLKPNNVILQATKEDPEQTEPPPGSCHLRGDCFIPRVVDFGLAKLLERGGPSETTTRQILGTPKYMAPEQAQARHEDVGPAADVYALGVILYEMLAGRAPFDGATDVEVLRQAIDGHLVHPRHIRPDLPRDLEAICLKAMDRSPGKRYRTAIDLSDDLRRFLDGKPTIARPLKWPGRAGRWLRRNDQAVAVVVLAVVAILLLVLGSWSMYQSQQFKSDRDTVLARQAAQTQADQQRVYSQTLRSAFLAWRAGDLKSATDSIEACRRIAQTGGEAPDFPCEYLAQLIAAERLTIPCPAGEVTALAVSRDGGQLATGHADGTAAVWDSASGTPVASCSAHDRVVEYAGFDGTGELITADVRGMTKAWKVTRGTLTSSHPVPSIKNTLRRGDLTVLSGNRLFTAGPDGVVRGYDATTAAGLLLGRSLTAPVTGVAIHPDDRSAAVSTHDLAIHRIDSRGQAGPVIAGNRRYDALRFTTQSSLTGIELRELGIVVSELTPVPREILSIPLRGATGLDLSPDKSHLVVADERGRLVVQSLVDRLPVVTFETGTSVKPRLVAISTGGRLVAAADGGGVRVWLLDSANVVANLSAHTTLMRFLPASERLATVGTNGTVRIWNANTGQEEWTIYAHVGRVTAVGGSPDGRTLVTGSVSGEVKFWDLRTGQELLSFCRHSGPVTRIEFSADGKRLVTVASTPDGTDQLVGWSGAAE